MGLMKFWALTTHGNHTGDCVIEKYGQCHTAKIIINLEDTLVVIKD